MTRYIGYQNRKKRNDGRNAGTLRRPASRSPIDARMSFPGEDYAGDTKVWFSCSSSASSRGIEAKRGQAKGGRRRGETVPVSAAVRTAEGWICCRWAALRAGMQGCAVMPCRRGAVTFIGVLSAWARIQRSRIQRGQRVARSADPQRRYANWRSHAAQRNVDRRRRGSFAKIRSL
jgi:hypothetical protein